MSLLLLFGGSGGLSVAGTVVNIAVGAPTGSIGANVSVTGAVVNIALGAPTGSIGSNVVVAGAVVNIALGAPTGSLASNALVAGSVVNIALGAPTGAIYITPPLLRDPLSALLRPSANSVQLIGRNNVMLSPTPNAEVH